MSALPQFDDREQDNTAELPELIFPDDLVAKMLPDKVFAFSEHGNPEIADLVEELGGLIELRFGDGLEADHTWKPGVWSGVSAIGLLKELTESGPQDVFEVGSGLGPLLGICEQLGYTPTGLEYNINAVNVSRRNVKKSTEVHHASLLSLIGSNEEDQAELDEKLRGATVYACIPQMRLPEHIINFHDKDYTGNYYPSEAIDYILTQPGMSAYAERVRKYDDINLGLVAGLLAEADKKCVGKVLVNVAFRPGEENVTQMLRDFGYDPSTVVEFLIPQDEDTDFIEMAKSESDDFSYEFFYKKEVEGKMELTKTSAKEAHGLRENGVKIYHKLGFIRGIRVEA
jgi:hypothetical protein